MRTIDWNVTARAGEPFVKLFREERETSVMLLVDLSGSQDFGTQLQTKRELVTELGATLAFSAIKNNDKVGLTLFTDHIEKSVPPRKGTRHVLRLIRELLYCQPIGRGTNVRAALEHLNRTASRRTVVFLISDFQDAGFEKTLRVTRRKHDVIPMVVTDPREDEMPNVGLLRLRDTETGKPFTIDTSSRRHRRAYREMRQRPIRIPRGNLSPPAFAADPYRHRRGLRRTAATFLPSQGVATLSHWFPGEIRRFGGHRMHLAFTLPFVLATVFLISFVLMSVVVAPVLLATGPASADTDEPDTLPRQTVADGPVEVMTHLDKSTATVAEPFPLTLQVEAPVGTSVTSPRFGPTLGPFTVTRAETLSELPIDGKPTRRRWRTSLELESLRTGDQSIPPIEIVYRLPEGVVNSAGSRDGVLRSRPLDVPITSVLKAEEDPAKFRDIKGVSEMPLVSDQRNTPIWIGIAGGIGALAVAGLVFWLRRDRTVDAKRHALHEVREVESRFQNKAIGIGEVYQRLSVALREYLEVEFAVPAICQSSEELEDALSRAGCGEVPTSSLRRFLAEADAVKFAGSHGPNGESDGLPFAMVREIIEKTSHDPQRVGGDLAGRAERT